MIDVALIAAMIVGFIAGFMVSLILFRSVYPPKKGRLLLDKTAPKIECYMYLDETPDNWKTNSKVSFIVEEIENPKNYMP